MPAAWQRAIVAAPLDDSSSGWAWTVRMQRAGSVLTQGTLTVAVAVAAVVDRPPAAPPGPHAGGDAGGQADEEPHRQRDLEQAGADDGPVDPVRLERGQRVEGDGDQEEADGGRSDAHRQAHGDGPSERPWRGDGGGVRCHSVSRKSTRLNSSH